MCGIIGFIGRSGGEHAQDFIMDQYQEQHTRGQRGFGLVRASKDSFSVRRAVEPMKALIDVSRAPDPILIFHHRMPTSTDNTMRQTHPILVSQDDLAHDYYIVHNGVISNAHELFKKHTEELGYTYRTYEEASKAYYHSKFNDSEAFAIELARVLDRKQDIIGSRGSMAYLGLQVDKATKKPVSVFWGTNGNNPLVWDETPNGIVIASELAYGYDCEETIYYSLALKDLFNPKNKDKKLEDMVDGFDIEFAPPPVIVEPPKATKVYGFSPEYKKDLEPKHLRYGEKDPADDAATTDYLNGKDVPQNYTPREWAFRKMGLRSLAKYNEVILNFYDQLALRTAYDPFNESTAQPSALEDEDIEFVIEELSDLLEDAATRAVKINGFYDMKEAEEDAKTFKEMAKEDTPLPLPANTTPHAPAPLTAQPLGSVDKRAWTEGADEAW